MEILAPAGSISALKAAVYSYADAVYLGLDKLNARLKADNFTTQNLEYWVEFCHMYGVKVYLTINTSIKNDEVETAKEIIACAKKAKVDAFIVADIAMYLLCKQLSPNIALHASTQMGIHNLLGAKFIENLGFKRVVLSREATLEEIKAIKLNTKLEVEYFSHGALCVSFSGGCLFSSIASGNSGNRGKCLQLCRKEYTNTLNGNTAFYMSPKDQCLIDKLKDLKTCGVDCIKIEGRMRSAEYVSTTVSLYRKSLNGNAISKDDRYKLAAVFNRGEFTSGYSFEKTKTIMFPNVQGHYGAKIGEIIACSISGKSYLITAKTNRKINEKFGVKIIENKKEIDGGELNPISFKDNILQFVWKSSLPIGANIHVTSDNTINCSLERCLKIKAFYSAKLNNHLSISLKYDKIEIVANSIFVCQTAKNQAITHAQIVKQLIKTGDTLYDIEDINGDLDDNLFIPNGIINELRREALNALTDKIIAQYNNQVDVEFKPIKLPKTTALNGTMIEVNNLNNFVSDKYTIVLNFDKKAISIMKNAINHNNIYIKLPKIALESDCKIIIDIINDLPQNIGIYADNYYAVQLAIELNRPIIYGFGLNVFNNLAAEFYGNSYCLSVELSAKELNAFKFGYVYNYGYLPIMTFAHCPYQLVTGGDCKVCKYQDFNYYDKYGSYKLTRIKVNNCQFVLDNSACHDLKDKAMKYRYFDLRRLNESELNEFFTTGKLPSAINKTIGHYIRGVE